MATLRQLGFHLDISGLVPELVSRDEKTRVPLEGLTTVQLEAVKNLAHDQYVRAMLTEDLDLDTHRATLNFLTRHLQKMASVPATQPRPGARMRKPTRNVRRTKSGSRQAA